MTRRRPAAPGYRPHPRRRFSHRVCIVCEGPFTLDRVKQPWSRARTCSASCARALGNRGRNPTNCRHCESVDAWRLAQDSDIRAIEVAASDEDRRAIPFREWLIATGREFRATADCR